VPQPVAQLPWSHNALLIERAKDVAARFWYANSRVSRIEFVPGLELLLPVADVILFLTI